MAEQLEALAAQVWVAPRRAALLQVFVHARVIACMFACARVSVCTGDAAKKALLPLQLSLSVLRVLVRACEMIRV